jgi:hypothetical protein
MLKACINKLQMQLKFLYVSTEKFFINKKRSLKYVCINYIFLLVFRMIEFINYEILIQMIKK